ncbi:zygote arrest protein 2.S-like [Littorina saxatilis]|uniref:3CxxC-type domain-containing protein n=1 Tax=Littorina saxatilis TaxID=31220 RepID=A0AAN9GK60_9CAEN
MSAKNPAKSPKSADQNKSQKIAEHNKTPKKDNPGSKTPKKDNPESKTPKKDNPGSKTPKKDNPESKTPKKDNPGSSPRRKNRTPPELDRRYGFYRCKGCGKQWESSHVYCISGTLKVMYRQDCKKCATPCFPYETEKIECSICHKTDCTCTEDDLKKRHVNANKEHLKDLCHKCRAGIPCQQSR